MSDLTYLSLGAGVQSTAVLVMSNLGLHGCPRADVAIFADTQSEPAWVYEHLAWLTDWSEIPVETCTAGDLRQHATEKQQGKRGRYANIPLWTLGAKGRAVPLRRHCTREYKIEPIEQHVRRRLGYKPRQRMKHRVEYLVGISLDEIVRAKPSRTPWATARWPLLDAGMRRRDCLALLARQGVPTPRKSSCSFCPYHDDRMWIELRAAAPKDFQTAVEFDRQMRDLSTSGLKQPAFVHRSLIPLDQVEFEPEAPMPLFDSFTEECEGMCGV